MNKTKYCAIFLLIFSILSSCTVINNSGVALKGIQEVIENGVIPDILADYDTMSEQIFYRYAPGATVVARYVKENGTGDGSSWDNASGDIQELLNGINDAGANKVYVVMIASGTYKPATSYIMKNHVALVGGFTGSPGNYDRIGKTYLDGNGSKRLFNNNDNDLNNTALLYGMIVTNGNNTGDGGGMYNNSSSPTLINITFSGNTAGSGGGMYNNSSSPTLINVTFSGNTADKGGGMYNNSSSPTLNSTTFSDNEAGYGGGMFNKASSPFLINVTFSDNTANDNNKNNSGGGMYNEGSSAPTLINVTFSGNTAHNKGGGMYNYGASSTLINVTFSGNTGSKGGNEIGHDGNGKELTLINTILWGNNNNNIIYVRNDQSIPETINLYYSLTGFEGKGEPTHTKAEPTHTFRIETIHLEDADTTSNPVTLNSKKNINNDNPLLNTLADNGGDIKTISIGDSSSAKDKGVYVKKEKKSSDLYYSINNTDWFSDPGLTSLSSLPSDTDDLTATDARVYSRIGRPDMGAYEVGGTP